MSTLREVAEAAGVDVSTVSRVLNRRTCQRVSSTTRQRIHAAAQRLDYRASAAARALVSGCTQVIGVSHARPDDPHVMPMLVEMHRIAVGYGFHLQIAFDRDQLHEWLAERRTDIAISVAPVDSADELANSIVAAHQQVLAIGPITRKAPENVLCACWQEENGLHDILDYLLELGHNHVAFLAGDRTIKKQMLFENLAAERGMKVSAIASDDERDMMGAGAQMARRLLDVSPLPTAVVARNDEFAIGALQTLREAGISIPEDLSVVGFNDISAAAYAYPSLTTVRTPLVECVRELLPRALENASDLTSPHSLDQLQ